jgi:hypothetical protein
MSKYSDHSTIGGQVLAHRFRMMAQNWRITGTIGKFVWLFSFFGYLFWNRRPNHVWNYLCCLKAAWRESMTTLPSTLFSSSWMVDRFGRWKEFSDNFIVTCPTLVQFKLQFEETLFFSLMLSIATAIFSVCLMLFINRRLGKSLTKGKEIISGRDYVDAGTLKKAVREKSDITLADIPYPKNTEILHTIITGTTGSGKTNIIIELLDQLKAKNEKIIIVDTIGTFLQKYCDPSKDIIMNPLDNRSVNWSFLNECREDTNILLKNTAACLIDRGSTGDRFWEDAAQIVFVETAKKAISEGKTTEEFLELLLKVSLNEIHAYLKGTYAYSLLDRGAEEMALSIRATLITAVSVFDILKESESNFSIRTWMTSDTGGTMFLSCTPAQRTTLIPLITAWLSIAAESLLHIAPTDKRTWFVKPPNFVPSYVS